MDSSQSKRGLRLIGRLLFPKKPAPKTGEKKDAIRENIEAFTVAIVMALLIKQFCFEAYKVPTESMEPTIAGRPSGGDRIIVNKSIYTMRDPHRWEVLVFAYPHNRLVNYVKRVVGMPNEWLFIRNGDIFTAPGDLDDVEVARSRATIERKPDSIQDALFDLTKCIPPGERDTDHFKYYWEKEPGDRGLGQVAPQIGEDAVSFRAENGLTLVRFTRPEAQRLSRNAGGAPTEIPAINNGRYDDWSRFAPQRGAFAELIGLPGPCQGDAPAAATTDEVGDVRLAFEVNPTDGKGEVQVEILDGTHGRPIRVALAVAGSGRTSRLEFDGKTEAFDVEVPSGSWTEVSVANVDDQILVRVEGDLVLRHDYQHDPMPANQPTIGGSPTTAPYNPNDPRTIPELPAPQPTHQLPHDNAVLFGFADGRASFRGIDLARDTYYTYSHATDFRIPESHYLPLGDNSPNSLDARGFKVSIVEYDEDGDGTFEREIVGDAEGVSHDESKVRPFVNPFEQDGVMKFEDVYGNTWVLDAARIKWIDDPEYRGGRRPMRTEYRHFVPREYVQGRAYVKFWPPLQIGLIR